jgi:phosphoglycolate phosphatase-like HAD superfamily hydrolase
LVGAGKQSCSYIGDAPEDIRMGKNAEVLTVAVPSSFPSSKDLHEAHPDIHVDSIKELLLHF